MHAAVEESSKFRGANELRRKIFYDKKSNSIWKTFKITRFSPLALPFRCLCSHAHVHVFMISYLPNLIGLAFPFQPTEIHLFHFLKFYFLFQAIRSHFSVIHSFFWNHLTAMRKYN